MPWSSGAYSRTKTFTNNVLPADLNSIQDDLGNQIETIMDKVGVSETSRIRRGASVITGTDTITSSSYAVMTTPDQVSSIFLPTDGLLVIAASMIWGAASSATPFAALFIGSNQLKIPITGAAPAVQEVSSINGTNFQALSTSPTGLITTNFGASIDKGINTILAIAAKDAPQGTPKWGGFTIVEAASGTYDISVRFKAATGTVSAKQRSLYVYSIGF